MEKEMIIAVNEESAEIFKEFAKKNDNIYCVEHKAFIGLTEITEFIGLFDCSTSV